MPIRKYGVLRGRPEERLPASNSSSHYHIRVFDGTSNYRVAVNAKSSGKPSEILYHVTEDLRPDLALAIRSLPAGPTRLRSAPGGPALDYLRGGLFDSRDMLPLPLDRPGPDNDLNELLDRYVLEAIGTEGAEVFAFGQIWGPDRKRPDPYFGFLPGRGVHNIHMNQGNAPPFLADNGVWQDGALLIRFPGERCAGIFLAFQSQAFRTNPRTGHRLGLWDEGARGHKRRRRQRIPAHD